MSRLRGEVLGWFASRRIAPDREREALRAAGLAPGAAEWHLFLSQLSLWLGTVALASAVIFFFAFNWDALGRFAKFGLVEGAILIGLVALWRLDLGSTPGKAAILLLTLLTGALLALTGQTYQTGADSYELFGWWAVLILPWVLVARFSPLWLLWLALLNLAVFLYFQRGWEAEPLLWSLFGLDALALIAWELAYRSGISWLRDEWPPRLVALAATFWATALAMTAIFDNLRGPGGSGTAALAYLAWLGALYGWYRRRRFDLFMLAVGTLSLIVVVAALLSETMLDSGSGGLLLIGLVVIGMAGGGAVWLRSLAREQPA